MSWQSMIDDFTTILNRDDCSAAQAAIFMTQGIQRIQRTCRLPSMERQLIITPTGATNFVVAPPDLIQPIDLIWTDSTGTIQRGLEKLGYRQLLTKNLYDQPRYYSRVQTQFWIRGQAGAGDTLQFFYYGNFSPFASTTADNELSASTPDLAVYAALAYAGEHYEHPSADRWEARFQEIKSEVQGMANDLDAEGGPQAIQSLYPDE